MEGSRAIWSAAKISTVWAWMAAGPVMPQTKEPHITIKRDFQRMSSGFFLQPLGSVDPRDGGKGFQQRAKVVLVRDDDARLALEHAVP